MSEKTFTAIYRGSTDRAQNTAGAVEIDGKLLEQDVAQKGLTQEQVDRLDALTYHRFEFSEGDARPGDGLDDLKPDGLDDLKPDELDALGTRYSVNTAAESKKADKIQALRDAGVSADQEGGG